MFDRNPKLEERIRAIFSQLRLLPDLAEFHHRFGEFGLRHVATRRNFRPQTFSPTRAISTSSTLFLVFHDRNESLWRGSSPESLTLSLCLLSGLKSWAWKSRAIMIF